MAARPSPTKCGWAYRLTERCSCRSSHVGRHHYSRPMQRVVYDKAEYHDETVEELELSEEHAANHTVFFLRWLIERSFVSAFFQNEGADIVRAFRAGEASIHDVYDWWDRCLISDMLSDEGNAFAQAYFDFERGEYLQDYARVLQGDLPSQFHVPYTEQNYQAMRAVIDARYAAWKASSRP